MHQRVISITRLMVRLACFLGGLIPAVVAGEVTQCGSMKSCMTVPLVSDDGHVQMVVEIPSGTNQKWEVSKKDGRLYLEEPGGLPRIINYLSYPGNYGFVPGTLLDESKGGDGDPLDIILIGPTVPRGSVVPVRIVGVLKLVDTGERDDKLIAVPVSAWLSDIRDIDGLYEGMQRILETWFKNYKGKNRMESLGFHNRLIALKILEASTDEFRLKGLNTEYRLLLK